MSMENFFQRMADKDKMPSILFHMSGGGVWTTKEIATVTKRGLSQTLIHLHKYVEDGVLERFGENIGGPDNGYMWRMVKNPYDKQR